MMFGNVRVENNKGWGGELVDNIRGVSCMDGDSEWLLLEVKTVNVERLSPPNSHWHFNVTRRAISSCFLVIHCCRLQRSGLGLLLDLAEQYWMLQTSRVTNNDYFV